MISIVIPVYKSEKTLGKCLESLMAQTYPDIEMVCVIDGLRISAEKSAMLMRKKIPESK